MSSQGGKAAASRCEGQGRKATATKNLSASMIFKKSIPRRTFLRGIGTCLSLPLLDGMIPALTALAQTPARPVLRLGIVYVPNGMIMDKWTPLTAGSAFERTPILEPVAAFRDKFLVLSGLAANGGRALEGEGAGDHARASA